MLTLSSVFWFFMLFNGCLSLILGWWSWKLLVSRLEICLILVLRPVWSPVELFLGEVPRVVPVLREPGAVRHSHGALPSRLRPGRGNTMSSWSVFTCFQRLANLSAHFLMRKGQMVRLPKGQRGKDPSLHTVQGSEPPFWGKVTWNPTHLTFNKWGIIKSKQGLILK